MTVCDCNDDEVYDMDLHFFAIRSSASLFPRRIFFSHKYKSGFIYRAEK